MPRKSNTAARRAEIVAAMLPVLAAHGYEKATIQAIAKQAGLTPGLVHYHFENKQHILVELVNTIAAFADARFEGIVADAGTPRERLRAYVEARLALGTGASAELAAAWVMIGAEAVLQDEVREVYRLAVATELARLTALLSECLAARRRSRAGAADIAAGLLALAQGAFALSSGAPEVMPIGYAARTAMEFADLAIAAAPRASGTSTSR